MRQSQAAPATPTQPTTWRSTCAAVTLGFTAGVIVVFLDYHNIVVDPWWLPIERPPTAVIIAALVGAALANAIGEELWWRTVLLKHQANLNTAAQYTFQVITFGIAHLHGIPSGLPGTVAAGAYSLLCLWIYRRWGWRYCVLTHTITDLVVFGAVAYWARFAFSGRREYLKFRSR